MNVNYPELVGIRPACKQLCCEIVSLCWKPVLRSLLRRSRDLWIRGGSLDAGDARRR